MGRMPCGYGAYRIMSTRSPGSNRICQRRNMSYTICLQPVLVPMYPPTGCGHVARKNRNGGLLPFLFDHTRYPPAVLKLRIKLHFLGFTSFIYHICNILIKCIYNNIFNQYRLLNDLTGLPVDRKRNNDHKYNTLYELLQGAIEPKHNQTVVEHTSKSTYQ